MSHSFSKNDRTTWLVSLVSFGKTRMELTGAALYEGVISKSGVFVGDSPVYTFSREPTESEEKILTLLVSSDDVYLNELEEFIKTINGSYQNGGWKHLCGSMITGLYYHQERNELYRGPPPLE